jgi:Rrf2 family transcriptional regulator, cysteine metabolism repressor
MKISAKLDYACRILCELAREYTRGNPLSIEHLSKAEAVPANFLAQILGELRTNNLVVSRRGVQGGFLLARAPEGITLFDIIKAMEGGLLELNGTNGDGRSGRRLRQIWDEIRGVAADKARAYTLEAMSNRTEASMYYI